MLPDPLDNRREEGLAPVESLLEPCGQEVEVVLDQLVELVQPRQLGLDWKTARTWGRNQRRMRRIRAP